jgi:RNA polymerase sigma-70 factor (ECF subfamily)
MGNDVDYAGIVKKAQLGEKESVELLSQFVQERLRVDIWRLTLDRELTQDIVQESLVEMLKMLSDLKEANRFWPWLYQIAINKVHRHYRKKSRHKTVPLWSVKDGDAAQDGMDGMAKAMGDELKEIVVGAMRTLKPRYRTVLTLRCYREMGYPEIGEAMGCSEFAAKMLFFRAKKSLKRQLGRYGFGKSSLLMALVLFGKLTAPSKAAAAQVSVAAASLKVGAVAGLAVLGTSKAVIVPVVTAGVLTVGTMVATSEPDRSIAGPEQEAVRSFEVGVAALEVSEGVEEYWYYYPQRAGGPVMMRMMAAEARGGQLHCAWRQNEEDNYYFDRGENTVHIRNRRMWREDLRVWRLPTDSRELSEFISEVEGQAGDMEIFRGRGEGLLVIARRGADEGNGLQIVRHYNILEEEYFYYSFPVNAKVVDERDAIHKRGWTYFRVSGEIDGEAVEGVGRIPFVYAASEVHKAWMRLKVGEREIVDEGFVGFGRPWMGLHTIDTVRRDAADRRIRYETKLRGGDSAEVKLTSGEGQLTYTVDMERDVVEKMRISTVNRRGAEGEVTFEYLQDISQAGVEFMRPRRFRGKEKSLFNELWDARQRKK